MRLIIMIAALLASTLVHAAQIKLVPVKKADGNSGITFKVPFTAGVHDGVVRSLGGEVLIADDRALKSARFTLSVDEMFTGNAVRDCHMREALALDYTRSAYPESHVCTADNQLPPNSAAFPFITFEWTSIRAAEGVMPTELEPGKVYRFLVAGTLSVHGVTKPMENIEVHIGNSGANTNIISLKSQFTVLLSDHAIEVKPFKFGPVQVKVKDAMKVSLDLRLEPKE